MVLHDKVGSGREVCENSTIVCDDSMYNNGEVCGRSDGGV